jgi:NodT family efflux transporter outer membrane factor (OMF) lipoprotein
MDRCTSERAGSNVPEMGFLSKGKRGWRLPDRRQMGGLLVGLAFLNGGGCGLSKWAHNGFKVGPNYAPPAVPVAESWIDESEPNLRSEPADLSLWWTVFSDPALNHLVVTAANQNINLRVAGMRILEARYRRQIAVGELFPQSQGAFGSFSQNKASANTALVPPTLWYSQWETGVSTSWEIDFWGRFRRSVEAADAELDASVESYDDILVLLLAEVAANYVDLRTFQERKRFAAANVIAQENAYRVTQDKLANGTATQRDVEQARSILEQTRALIPLFEEGERLANNRLCVLLGVPPQNLVAHSLGDGTIPVTPVEVAIGVPADLIRRRPDVRRAEREVAAQSARIGIAEADLYPHLTLNGTLGVAAEDFGDLFDGNKSLIGNVGPAFRWDLLNYGRLVNRINLQDAKFQAAAFAYQQTVLEAGAEAEDGVIRFLKSKQRSRNLDASAEAADITRRITIDQYRQGVVDFTAVFITESEVSRVQDAAADARGRMALSLIALYRALGGGWEMRLLPPEMVHAGSHGPLGQPHANERHAEEILAMPPDPNAAAPPALPANPGNPTPPAE